MSRSGELVVAAGPWREVELTFIAVATHAHPYAGVDLWVDFRQADRVISRPAFWDGGRTWRVRFAAPLAGEWAWTSRANVVDDGLHGRDGVVACPTSSRQREHEFYDHGFWRMDKSQRNLVHADGTPALIVADTAWALPWRATPEQVRVYAADRHDKGFNAALLMSIQPDMRARGPGDRTQDEGFGIGFEDLPDGHLNKLNPAYFEYLDGLLDILVEHEIVPVLQPVFHGFGWKGLGVAGPVVPPEEYARYCRYLVARFGARPAVYLVGADGNGSESQIEAGGVEVESSDAYGQPTGIHYEPHGLNHVHQDAEWLDFQWCQTGHEGEHLPERVADMWRNVPAKGVANAEPSYEHTGRRGHAEGWWQGHEAWSNLCAGGTMGVFYGAASLWQWRLHAEEGGHSPYFLAEDAGWREALDFDGAKYVGLVGKIMKPLPFLGMAPDWHHIVSSRGLSVPGKLLVVYRERGGFLIPKEETIPRHVTIVDPRTGEVLRRLHLADGLDWIQDPGEGPRVYVFTQAPAEYPQETPLRS